MKRLEQVDNSEHCSACGSQVKYFLHNVRHRDDYLRLCTSCVLKHHSGSFCPHCFDLYEGFSPPVNPILCIKCGFSSHFDCVEDKDAVAASRYVCPTCVNPNHVFFDVGIVSNKKKKRKEDGESSSVKGNGTTIDLKLSKVLLAAAHFAAVSMSKAAVAAMVAAEERGKVAVSVRKQAREAIDRVNYLAKQKRFRDQAVMAVPNGNGRSVEGRVKQVGPHVSNAVREEEMPINGVAAAPPVADDHKINGSLKPVMGHQHSQNPVAVNETEKSFKLSHSENNVVQGEKKKNGLHSGTHTTGKAQHPHNSHPPIEDREKFKELSNSQMVPELTHMNEGSAEALVSRSNGGVSQAGLSKMS